MLKKDMKINKHVYQATLDKKITIGIFTFWKCDNKVSNDNSLVDYIDKLSLEVECYELKEI